MSDEEGKAEHQAEAEAEVQRFHDQRGPFVVAAETTRMPMVFTNAREPEHPIIFANDSLLRLTGYERDEVLGQDFAFFLSNPDDQDVLAKVEAEFGSEVDEERRTEVECRRKDGSTLWVALLASPVRDDEGEIVQHFASLVDLTRHHQAQAQSRLLIDELNHRVKNTLATVQSIAAQALRHSPDMGAAREAIEARLFALAHSHELLTREAWTGASLRDVVVSALRPFDPAVHDRSGGSSGHAAGRIAIVGEGDVRLAPRAVLTLSIALHELATNAVKYGALSADMGRVLIDWIKQAAPDGDLLALRWREVGGPPVAPPTRKGFGLRMIERGLAHELGGEVRLDYRPDGLVCRASIPIKADHRQ